MERQTHQCNDGHGGGSFGGGQRHRKKMNIPYSTKYSQVYGLGRTALAVFGTARVAIDVGDGRPLEHEIEVLDTNNRVV